MLLILNKEILNPFVLCLKEAPQKHDSTYTKGLNHAQPCSVVLNLIEERILKMESQNYISQHLEQYFRQKPVWVSHPVLKPWMKAIKPIQRTWNLNLFFWNFWRDAKDIIKAGQNSTINEPLHLLHLTNINLSLISNNYG